MICVRFAPSPTGYIHIGNSRIALANWLFAMQECGDFILRYDDTDVERSKTGYAQAIAEDLDWLGIRPTRHFFQSHRFAIYNQVTRQMKQAGLLYPCYETADELERQRKIRLSRKLPPIYGREALKLTPEQRQELEAQGRKPHWRFLLPNYDVDPFVTRRRDVHWQDMVRGSQKVDLSSLSDPVLVRGDGSYLYTLPSVVDDRDMGITHIIRGDDHITNTGVQIALFEALKQFPKNDAETEKLQEGGNPSHSRADSDAHLPTFGHINLLTKASGEGLSKRKGDLSLRSLREEGFEPMTVASLAVLTGTSVNVTACPNMEALAEKFRFTSLSRSAAKFDPQDLIGLNAQIVHQLDLKDVRSRLEQIGIRDDARIKDFWQAVRENLGKVDEAGKWWTILTEENLSFDADIVYAPKDVDFFAMATALLPDEPWDQTIWQKWTTKLKEKTGRKGKSLFQPLRLALTGLDKGPELALLLPLLGREKILKRLEQFPKITASSFG